MEWKALETNCGGALAFNMESISEVFFEDYLKERRDSAFHEYPDIIDKYLERSFDYMMEDMADDCRPMCVCTTNENQTWANEKLKKEGFKMVGECVNPNSNNVIYLWFKDLICAEQMDEDEWEEE